jgi:RimJ/RimL family protein N-acetyltransferase
MTAPVLETERLILRGPMLTDFPAHAALWSDPRMAVFDCTQTEEESWVNFHFNAGQWALKNVGSWSLVEKASGFYMGTVGFQYTNRTIDYEGRNAAEVSWGIAADFHRQGFVREALRTILIWADTNLPETHTWCFIQPDNEASLALAKGEGYVEIQRLDYRGKPMVVLARDRKVA